MQKIEYDKYGGPELMRLEEVEPPVPGRGRLLVRVRAARPRQEAAATRPRQTPELSASTRSSASTSIRYASKAASTLSSTRSARCRSAPRAPTQARRPHRRHQHDSG
jgi:hypothetical protein